MSESPIDYIQIKITNGICPACGRYVKVENNTFVKHFERYGSRKKVDLCVNSDRPIPPDWR